jgi:hypothetical protein
MLLLLALLACGPQGPAPKATTAPTPHARSTTNAKANEDAWFTPQQLELSSKAAERGLAWLKRQQLPGGGFTGYVGHKIQDDYALLERGLLPEQQRQLDRGHLGVTALCGMAFLGGGHLPDRGPFAEPVRKLHDYIVRTSQENGFLTDAGSRMYEHAFATLFLAEIYGMAATATTKASLERAVNLIVDCQNQHGGWRYNPFDRETDLSVTVCQIQALRAARNVGIRVPRETIDRAIAYVQQSRVANGRFRGLFFYKIHGRGAYDKPAEYAINAAALTALSSAGIQDDDISDPVLTFLERDYATLQDYYPTHFYFWYGNYYAAQAFYQHGGPRLRSFYARLAADLLPSQQADGRWLNRVGPGDAFSTAVACILLQMPKQYLPIFQR